MNNFGRPLKRYYMTQDDKSQKRQFQEVQYQLPYHWMLKGSAIPIYDSRNKLLITMIKNLPGEKRRALDLGCGDGKNTFELQKALGDTVQFTGIDFSENAIGFAKLIVPAIDFRVQDASCIDFPDGYFDLLVSIEVIEHIHPDEMSRFLGEIRRVLKPGGGFVLTTPTVNLPLNEKHYQHFTAEKMSDLLLEAGFAIMEIKGFGWHLSAFPNKIYKSMLSWPGLWRLSKRVGGRVLDWKRANTIAVSAIKL